MWKRNTVNIFALFFSPPSFLLDSYSFSKLVSYMIRSCCHNVSGVLVNEFLRHFHNDRRFVSAFDNSVFWILYFSYITPCAIAFHYRARVSLRSYGSPGRCKSVSDKRWWWKTGSLFHFHSTTVRMGAIIIIFA